MGRKPVFYTGITIVILILIVGEVYFFFFNQNGGIKNFLQQSQSLPLPKATTSNTAGTNEKLGDLATGIINKEFTIRVKLLKVYQNKDLIKADIAYNLKGGTGNLTTLTIALGTTQQVMIPFALQKQNIDTMTPTSKQVTPRVPLTLQGSEIVHTLSPYKNDIVYIHFLLQTLPEMTKGKTTTPLLQFIESTYSCNMHMYRFTLGTENKPSCIPFSSTLNVYVPN